MTQEFSDIVNHTIQEYASIFPLLKKQLTTDRHINWTQVEAKLQHEMEWTQEGANYNTPQK